MGRTTNTQKTAEQKPKQEAKAPEQEPQQATQEPEKEPAVQAPEQEPQQATQEPEKEPAVQAPEQEPTAQPQDGQEPPKAEPDGMVMVEVVQAYKDLELKRIVKKGESLPMLPERAAVIIGKKLGKAVEE